MIALLKNMVHCYAQMFKQKFLEEVTDLLIEMNMLCLKKLVPMLIDVQEFQGMQQNGLPRY